MGKVKASQLMAAFELGRRMAAFLEEKPQIGSPADVARIVMPSMRDLQRELLYVLCLDTKNNVTKQRRIFEGSLNASIIHPREVFRFAIEEQRHRLSLCITIHLRSRPKSRGYPCHEAIRRGRELLQISVTDTLSSETDAISV